MKKDSTAGNKKQDKIAQREAAKLKRDQLKVYRHDLSILKRKGLIARDYDVRNAQPTRTMRANIQKYSNVLQGDARTVKVSKQKAEYYKEQGFTVRNGRVVVPVAKNEKVYGAGGDFRVKTIGPNGSITRIDVGLPKKDILKWKEKLIELHPKLKEGERLFFQFYGNNSYGPFQTLEQLVMQLELYATFERVENSADPSQEAQLIENIVIYKIDRNSEKPPRDSLSEERIQERRAKRRVVRERYEDRMDDSEYEKYRKKKAEAAREFREKEKSKLTPEQLQKKKDAAKARAKKSYEARSGKKGNSNN